MIPKQVIRYENNPSVLEATWVDENDVVIKCQSYGVAEFGQLRADLGADAAQYESLIAEVEATYVPPEPEPMTPEKLQELVVQATQAHLDNFARTRNYDGILSACTYADSSVPKFAAEGQYAVQARDATWAALYVLLAEVQAGARPAPASFDDVQPLLPVLEWPV